MKRRIWHKMWLMQQRMDITDYDGRSRERDVFVEVATKVELKGSGDRQVEVQGAEGNEDFCNTGSVWWSARGEGGRGGG